ncbi:MAG: transketolase [Candidatus Zixiibacteriota bacterium]|nr:MAG: transketolase [candidate division Zixibacteria bacterium]
MDELCVSTIRFLSVDAVEKANSGHPGMPLDAAPMAYVLWTRHLKHNPANPGWFDRDRFVLSGGHGSMLLYSLLHLTGYDLPLEQIRHFRQWGSVTPGHPERHVAAGVEVTTGPLGQGFGNSVGLAMGEAHLAARFNRPGAEIIHHYTYGIASDGDMMEGVSSEAASLAGHLGLGRLIYFYDANQVTLAAGTDIAFTEDVGLRFEAYGWHVQYVGDGNDLAALDRSLRQAREETGRPSLIIVRTHIGYGAPHKQDSFEAHGSPLGEEEVRQTKRRLGWPEDPPFHLPEEALRRFRRAVDRGAKLEADWNTRLANYRQKYPDLGEELAGMMEGRLPEDWDADLPRFPTDPKGMPTRKASGKTLNALAARVPGLIGGSADLNPSTYTALKDLGDFQDPDGAFTDLQGSSGGPWDYTGRNLHFGVREHAMGGALNGMAAHGGLIPYGATFLIFSDYMRPTIRLAALSSLHVIYVFTHDSIGLGEDGPTHQPVEHLPSLRAIPGLTVIRPGDANETAQAWKVAVEVQENPVALVLSRQNVPVLDRDRYASAEGLRRGAYVLYDSPGGPPELILIASGSELPLIAQAAEKLEAEGRKVRAVSMPSWELFEQQSPEYRDEVLPPGVTARLAVEAASPLGWHRWVGDRGAVIGVEKFGASAPGPEVLRRYGFTVENVVEKARELAGEG